MESATRNSDATADDNNSIVFEGVGLNELGSCQKQPSTEEDEFDYSYDTSRPSGYHQQVFRPAAMPAHLVSSLHQRSMVALEEGDEEDEEEAARQEEAMAREMQAAEEYEAGTPPAVSNSWTTFNVSTTANESFALEADNSVALTDQGITGEIDMAPSGSQQAAPSNMPSSHLIGMLNARPRLRAVLPAAAAAACANAHHRSVAAGGEGGGKEAQTLFQVPPSTSIVNSLRASTSNSQVILCDDISVDLSSTSHSPPHPASPAQTGAAISKVSPPLGHRSPQVGSCCCRTDCPMLAATAAAEAGALGAAAQGRPPGDEWELANRARDEELARRRQQQQTGPQPPLSYQEAAEYLKTADVQQYRSKVVAAMDEQTTGWWGKLKGLLHPPTPLVKEQQVHLLSLAQIPFNDGDRGHWRLLAAVYAAYTGAMSPPPRHGDHWAQLGFQGSDPSTDLRGCGMLGLLQLLYLPAHHAPSAQHLFRLSRHPTQEFPLAIVSLNATKWTLQVVRSGALLPAARKAQSLDAAATEFYTGAMYAFYHRWRRGATMVQSGFILKDVGEGCIKKPSATIALASRPLPPPPDGC